MNDMEELWLSASSQTNGFLTFDHPDVIPFLVASEGVGQKSQAWPTLFTSFRLSLFWRTHTLLFDLNEWMNFMQSAPVGCRNMCEMAVSIRLLSNSNFWQDSIFCLVHLIHSKRHASTQAVRWWMVMQSHYCKFLGLSKVGSKVQFSKSGQTKMDQGLTFQKLQPSGWNVLGFQDPMVEVLWHLWKHCEGSRCLDPRGECRACSMTWELTS